MIDKQALLNRLLEYVQIDSETGDEKNMGLRLVEDLKALGCEVHTDEIREAANTTGFNVYARLSGQPEAEPILFSSHMDTVIPGKGVKPVVCDDGYVRSDGSTVLGGDDKAGLSAIIEALKAAKEVPHRTVEVLFTVREESGMHGAKNADYSWFTAKNAVVFDTGGHPSDIVTAAPGQNKILAVFTGRKAHAGIAPEDGISAIEVAAHAVSNMKLLRVDEETTCNIGTLLAQGPTNIVNDTCRLEMEVRSLNNQKLEVHTQHLVGCMQQAAKDFGAQVAVEVSTSYYGFKVEEEHPFLQQVLQQARLLGFEPRTMGSGGGSDANIFNRNGICAFNLGVGMDKVHTTQEQQSISQMEDAALLALQLMKL